MLEGLYYDIGKKIKGWAKWCFIVEAAAACVGSLVFFISMIDMDLAFLGLILGILMAVAGIFVAWVSSWILYGFGELIDRVCSIEEKMGEAPASIIKPAAEPTYTPAYTPTYRNGAPTRVSGPSFTASGWTCVCGRSHPAYESSCVCGVSKAEIKAKTQQQ